MLMLLQLLQLLLLQQLLLRVVMDRGRLECWLVNWH
jgi:hypothetical protein